MCACMQAGVFMYVRMYVYVQVCVCVFVVYVCAHKNIRAPCPNSILPL